MPKRNEPAVLAALQPLFANFGVRAHHGIIEELMEKDVCLVELSIGELGVAHAVPYEAPVPVLLVAVPKESSSQTVDNPEPKKKEKGKK